MTTFTDHHLEAIESWRGRIFAPRPTNSPSQWCVDNLIFDEPQNHGPFKTVGREYITEVVDCFANTSLTDTVLTWGSQTGKTTVLEGGAAWCAVNDPCGFLWVMPNQDLAKKFARQRWIKMLHASPETKRMIPVKGMARHSFATLTQQLGGSVFNFVGSNSAANLASTPCRRVILDEVDKFDAGGREEADAVNLAEQRTKDIPYPQRWKTSTPTLFDGLIWQQSLMGDMRRYFVPCPHCSKLVVLAWSRQYTVFSPRGDEAFIKWDAESKRPNGTWDLGRVESSAHAECPHCAGKIRNDQKTKMVREGKWIATNTAAASSFRSYHLPSLYANSPQTSFGAMAVRFLQAKQSANGLQGFINGELAEPYMRQDRMTERVNVIRGRLEVTAEWRKILTSDCQRRAPFFHYVIRAWNGTDASHGLEFGMLGSNNLEQAKTELAAIVTKYDINPVHVVLDSGYGAKPGAETDFSVYLLCAEHSIVDERFEPAMCLGWMPAKGMPGSKRWINKDTRASLPYGLSSVDPMAGTSMAGTRKMNLFEFNSDFYKTELDKLRAGDSAFKWSVSEAMDADEYWKQLNAEHQVKRGNLMIWEKLHSRMRNEALDCEVMQLAYASFMGYINLGIEKQ